MIRITRRDNVGDESAAAATDALPGSRIARSICNLCPTAIPRSLRCRSVKSRRNISLVFGKNLQRPRTCHFLGQSAIYCIAATNGRDLKEFSSTTHIYRRVLPTCTCTDVYVY
jgi:hypothetical protein